eukprot:scaffold4511_cov171-Amphora_coffeaeformis.AAC.42
MVRCVKGVLSLTHVDYPSIHDPNFSPLPNPNNEFITAGGFEGYHSGGILSWRKSGDTGGYSSRISYSALKGRAAIAVDTCGGCGSQGTAGSGAQRAALILADGPPEPMAGTRQTTTAESTGVVFVGDALSHNFPSVAQLNIEVYPSEDGGTATIALSSSDGAGATTNAATNVGDGKWVITEPIYMGTGWGATRDPFNQLDIQRSLIISADGKTAFYQDMGADTALEILGEEEPMDSPTEAPEDDSSGSIWLMGIASILFFVNSLILV